MAEPLIWWCNGGIVSGFGAQTIIRSQEVHGRGIGRSLETLSAAPRYATQRTADPTHRLVAHDALGVTLFYLGDYATRAGRCWGLWCNSGTMA